MKIKHVSWELHIKDVEGYSEVCAMEYDSHELDDVVSDALTLSEIGFEVFIVPYVYYTMEDEKDGD